jgi:hypothetical protein
MSKTRLDLDRLDVETFATTPVAGHGGTTSARHHEAHRLPDLYVVLRKL